MVEAEVSELFPGGQVACVAVVRDTSRLEPVARQYSQARTALEDLLDYYDAKVSPGPRSRHGGRGGGGGARRGAGGREGLPGSGRPGAGAVAGAAPGRDAVGSGAAAARGAPAAAEPAGYASVGTTAGAGGGCGGGAGGAEAAAAAAGQIVPQQGPGQQCRQEEGSTSDGGRSSWTMMSCAGWFKGCCRKQHPSEHAFLLRSRPVRRPQVTNRGTNLTDGRAVGSPIQVPDAAQMTSASLHPTCSRLHLCPCITTCPHSAWHVRCTVRAPATSRGGILKHQSLQ